MRSLSSVLLFGAFLGCSSSDLPLPPEPVAGVWTLDSASPGIPPRTMTLAQHGASVTGTGSAMGVDVPIPIAVSGTYSAGTAVSPPLVTLVFQFQNGGGVTAQFSGTLTAPDRIAGSVVYYGITSNPQPGTLAFSRH